MRPLRLMIVGPYPDAGVARGGVDAAVEGLVSSLAHRDEIGSILVLSPERRLDHVEFSANSKTRVLRIPAQRLALSTGGFRDVWAARAAAREFGADLIHGQGVGRAGDVATRLGWPSVVTVHGMAHIEERALAGDSLRGRARVALVERMVRRVLDRANAVISISEYDRAQLVPRDGTPVFVIPNAARLEFFDIPIVESESLAFYSGGIVRRKNPLGLVTAFASVTKMLPDARLVIAGGSPDLAYAQEVRAAANSVGPAISFPGALDTNSLSRVLERSRCAVLYSHQETLPCAIAEAMAAGRAVVASDVGGIGEMITSGENGFLVVDGDEPALVAALCRCLGDEELAQRLGARGREVALSRFHPDAIADATLGVYRTVLSAAVKS